MSETKEEEKSTTQTQEQELKFKGVPVPADPDDKASTFHYMREMREKYTIKITPLKTMHFNDFVKSLDVDPRKFYFLPQRKSNFNSYVHFLEVELEHAATEKGTLKWILKKRFKDLIEFQNKLNQELEKKGKMTTSEIPQISHFYNSRLKRNPEDFLSAAQQYLQKLLETREIRVKSKLLYEFIELSLLPLPNGPTKYKEGLLKKRGGGRFKKNKLGLYFSFLCRRWQERWFILTEQGIIYMVNSNNIKAREMLLFDQSFSIEYGKKLTGRSEGISIVVPNRRLNVEAKDSFEALVWIDEIQKAAKACPYTKENRFDSFAPVREPNNFCQWYVDAEGYYEDLYHMLNLAKREVFILDWWLTPELPLKRPVESPENEYRLDKVLAKIANAGVKVYIIVYNEVKALMYNHSDHTKKALESLSPNITVLQHPSEPFFSWSHHEKMVVIDQAIGFLGGFDLCFGRFDVSSHPLVDPAEVEGKGQMFVGKDYANPRIMDFKEVIEHDVPLIDKKTTPRLPWHDAMVQVCGAVVADMSRHFIQYWNHVEVDVYRKEKEAPLPKNVLPAPTNEVISKREQSTAKLRSAFRKIFGGRVIADSIQKGEISKGSPEKIGEQKENIQNKKGNSIESRSTIASIKDQRNNGNRNGSQEKVNSREDMQETPRKEGGKEKERNGSCEKAKRSPSSITSLDEKLNKEEESKEKETKKAEPERDHEVEEEKEKTKGKGLHKITSAFLYPAIQEEYHKEKDKEEKSKSSKTGFFRSLFGKICGGRRKKRHEEGDLPDEDFEPEQKSLLDFSHKRDKDKAAKYCKGLSNQFYEKRMLQLLFSPQQKIKEGTCACQVVRSASKWSLGLNKAADEGENSIENAYVHIIGNAKHFIYMENQFFMSNTAGSVLKNRVGQALVERIEKAHKAREKFRVVIFLPLVHAFEGEITESKSAIIRIQMHWQYKTIGRGGESIYETLEKQGIKPDEYIQFYGLRTHAKMPNGEPVTEQIYIHSKIIIADDDILLIGSANINDRSLLGSRDSELAIVIEDSNKIKSRLNGKEVSVGEQACTMRKRLMAEHLGWKEEEVTDPLDEGFIKKMNQIAQRNTEIYREVFACYPDDNMKTYKEVEEMSQRKNLSRYDELAPEIKGHIVYFPIHFLNGETLEAQLSSVEYYIPDETYV